MGGVHFFFADGRKRRQKKKKKIKTAFGFENLMPFFFLRVLALYICIYKHIYRYLHIY